MRTIPTLPVALFTALAAAACSDSSVTPRDAAGPTADAAAHFDASADAPHDAAFTGVCTPGAATPSAQCPAGQYCSATSRCIATGSCADDRDCTAGNTCGRGSGRCFAPGMCASAGDCPAGMTCGEDTGRCEIGGGCGAAVIPATRVAPNVMILLDRSGSMSETIDGRTRWDIAKDAVATVTTRYNNEIRFGLATYSACLPGGCSAGTVVVPLADTNATAINGFLAPLRGTGSPTGTPPDYLCDGPNPETSTGVSLHALVGDRSLQDAARANYVLLMTDGGENPECTTGGRPDGAAGARSLASQSVPVHTYVVGFSRDTNPDQLTAIATAGGTGMYYQADNAAALVSAFSSIAAAVRSCTYHLASAPPDPSMLYVFFNRDPSHIAMNATDGWTYDAATQSVVFHGRACTQVQDGTAARIDIVYGCAQPPPG